MVELFIPSKVLVAWVDQSKTFRHITSEEKFYALNHELFKHIRPWILDDKSNWLGFYDLQSVGCPLHFLSRDGVHMEYVFYKVMMGQLLHIMATKV